MFFALAIVCWTTPQTSTAQHGVPTAGVLSARSDEEQPLVSVILTLNNVAEYAETSVLGVLGQSYGNLEILVVDDASEDKTTSIVEMLTSSDSRVRRIFLRSNSMGGVGTPSNLALEQAKGTYVAFVDGDDIVLPDFVSENVKLAQRGLSDVVIDRFDTFKHDEYVLKGQTDQSRWPSTETIAKSQRYPIHAGTHPILYRLYPVPWRKFYRRSFLRDNDIRFPEGDYVFEDFPFHWSVMIAAKRVSILDKSFIYYRLGRKGQSTSLKSKAKVTSLSAVYFNTHHIGLRVEKCVAGNACSVAKDEFLAWVRDPKEWLLDAVRNTGDGKLHSKFLSLHAQVRSHWETRLGLRPPAERNVDIDVSIVIPCRGEPTIVDNFIRKAALLQSRAEVIFVLDAATENAEKSLAALSSGHENVYVITSHSVGAGKARNFAVPLCQGAYVIFIDGDETFHPGNLDAAIQAAKHAAADVVMVPWKIHGSRDGTVYNSTLQQVSRAHPSLWLEDGSVPSREYKYAAMKLTTNPRSRLVRRAVLVEGNIFFGPTVTGQILFHWHTLLVAKRIYFFHGSSVLSVSKILDEKAMTKTGGAALSDSLLLTNRVLVNSGMRQDQRLLHAWSQFAAGLATQPALLTTSREWGEAQLGLRHDVQ
jgi:glycosyltransferase involved in cell wall biosynthesis